MPRASEAVSGHYQSQVSRVCVGRKQEIVPARGHIVCLGLGPLYRGAHDDYLAACALETVTCHNQPQLLPVFSTSGVHEFRFRQSASLDPAISYSPEHVPHPSPRAHPLAFAPPAHSCCAGTTPCGSCSTFLTALWRSLWCRSLSCCA
jgi:hypothetical protein